MIIPEITLNMLVISVFILGNFCISLPLLAFAMSTAMVIATITMLLMLMGCARFSVRVLCVG